MDLETMRLQLRDRFADPHGDVLDDPYATRLLNVCLTDVVNLTDDAPFDWNQNAAYLDVSVTSAAREYALTGITERIIDVHEVLSDGRERPPETIAPYAQRNRRSYGVYLLRKGGSWYLGTCRNPPTARTLRVRYRVDPFIGELIYDSDEPTLIPKRFHHVIVLRAAVVAKSDANRELGGLALLYAEQLAKLQEYLAAPAQPGQARRI